MRIADVSIHRPVFATMLIGSLVALGAVSYGRLGVDLFPHIEFPYVAVTTALVGASPETIETEVTDVIEEELNTISGIEELHSVSSEGLSQVFLQFELDEDPDAKAQDARQGRTRAASSVDAEPRSSRRSTLTLRRFSRHGVRQLPVRDSPISRDAIGNNSSVSPGVGSITIVGGREREIRVWVDGARLRGHGLAVDDVIAALRAEHAEVPGGFLEADGQRSEFAVKTEGEVESVRGFEGITVAFRQGRATRLRDVARVEDGMEDERPMQSWMGSRACARSPPPTGRNTGRWRDGESGRRQPQGEAPAGVISQWHATSALHRGSA